ncbi:hypothetical protein AMECASPLE_037997 [Ameca splendens]|uniref:Uncharacterized protein n=1 Tax=Ameca splendens TaxID=208324 RepID=A0ABV1A3H5_9TELE
MRITPSHTGLTPFEIVHGRPFPLPSEMNDIEKAQHETSLAEWMNKMLQTKETQLSSSLPVNSAPIPQNNLRPGDLVLIKTLQRKDWSTPRWTLPSSPDHAYCSENRRETFLDSQEPL